MKRGGLWARFGQDTEAEPACPAGCQGALGSSWLQVEIMYMVFLEEGLYGVTGETFFFWGKSPALALCSYWSTSWLPCIFQAVIKQLYYPQRQLSGADISFLFSLFIIVKVSYGDETGQTDVYRKMRESLLTWILRWCEFFNHIIDDKKLFPGNSVGIMLS